jgi:hypothetical protein
MGDEWREQIVSEIVRLLYPLHSEVEAALAAVKADQLPEHVGQGDFLATHWINNLYSQYSWDPDLARIVAR